MGVSSCTPSLGASEEFEYPVPSLVVRYLPGQSLVIFDSRLVEFVAIMVISLVILALSLLASRIIRLSPFLGHYLFGVKYAKEQPIGK